MNVPRLRFKEFNKSYNTKEIKEITYNVASGKISKPVEDGNYNIYGSMGKIGTSNFYDYEGEKVLVARVGANAGSVNKINEKCCISDNTLVLEPKDVLNDYLYYSLKHYNPQKLIFGSGQPLVTGGQLKQIKLGIPEEKEQLKVANFLSLLDKKIELQTKKIEALKLFKKGLISKLLNDYDYEIMKIKDVLKFEQPTKYIVNSDDYINDSKAIPVLTANKAFILGYCNENNFYDKGDSIIFDDFTMDMKYTNFNYKIKSSAIKILTANDNNDLRFLYELLLSLNLKSEEHKRHYISIVQEMDVKIPNIEVQNSISSKLELVDNKILFEEKFLDNLTKLKKGFMQNMFV